MPVKIDKRRRNRVFPSLERLEDRCTPATVSVATTAQLQLAIRNAGNFDTIVMQPGVYSVSGSINANLLNVNLTIKAANSNTVAIDGGGGTPLVSILNPNGNPGTQIQFQNITFQNGRGTASAVSGGVSTTNANVTFTGCLFQQNLASVDQAEAHFLISGNSTGPLHQHYVSSQWLRHQWRRH